MTLRDLHLRYDGAIPDRVMRAYQAGGHLRAIANELRCRIPHLQRLLAVYRRTGRRNSARTILDLIKRHRRELRGVLADIRRTQT